MYHDGYLYYDFVLDYDREHSQLEELHLSRQIFGVVGLMDCQVCPKLADGMKQFQQIVQKYSTCLISRCFAFDPLESQTDDIKGLIMIPNIGDLSFYLQTMINDFTADMLLAFGSFVLLIHLVWPT